jgi:hypothetical protein
VEGTAKFGTTVFCIVLIKTINPSDTNTGPDIETITWNGIEYGSNVILKKA